MIVTLFPEMVVQSDRELTPGVSLPMYEGARVCGHGTVIWQLRISDAGRHPDAVG